VSYSIVPKSPQQLAKTRAYNATYADHRPPKASRPRSRGDSRCASCRCRYHSQPELLLGHCAACSKGTRTRRRADMRQAQCTN
jgi:hypothetical protein